jgi:hypothetical protein
MTTGWIIVNIVLVAVAAVIVAVPAVLIPLRLDRDVRKATRTARPQRQPASSLGWVYDGQQRDAA